jgi:hypothetical protein
MQDLLRMHLSAEVPPMSYARPGLPEGVDDAVRRALAKDPAHRFSSVTAFVDSLAGLRPANTAAMTGRGVRFEKVAARPQKKSVRGAVFALVLACAAGAAFAFPQTRDPIMGALLPMLQVVDSMTGVKQVPNAGGPDTAAAHVGAADATTDSATIADSASVAHDSVSRGPVQLAPAPIALDTALSSSMPDTRVMSRMQYGWIKVVINGGTAPAYIDGSRLGSTPQMVRVEAGEHLVTVLGAGDSFLPSQITLTVSANDTTPAVFYSPEAMRRAQAAKAGRDTSSVKATAADSTSSPAAPPRR